jgi:transcriptional regulator with XRE-family HTH domain
MATESSIGENIKKRRTKLGLSQEDFAQNRALNIRPYQIESGVIETPSVLMVEKLCRFINRRFVKINI